MREYRKPADCHPDRRHAAKGLCFPCYQQLYPKAERADCHPDRVSYIGGKCRTCYDRDLKERNPEYAERQRANHAAWVDGSGRDWKREYDRAYAAKNRGQKSARDREAALAAFGLTWEDERSECDICGESAYRRLDIDHDHASGLFRGFLCGRCNKGLGLLGDSAASLRNALEYLQNHESSQAHTEWLDRTGA